MKKVLLNVLASPVLNRVVYAVLGGTGVSAGTAQEVPPDVAVVSLLSFALAALSEWAGKRARAA